MPRFPQRYRIGGPVPFLLLLAGLAGCRVAEPTPTIYVPPDEAAPQASLVSIQPTGATSAEVVVKVIGPPNATGWTLTALGRDRPGATFETGGTQLLDPFQLVTQTVSGLVAGQTYRFQLKFRFGSQDTVTALRSYTHKLDTSPTEGGPRWTRLAHLPAREGDFTGYPIPFGDSRTDGAAVARYRNADSTDYWYYFRDGNRWESFFGFRLGPQAIPPRRGIVQFLLYGFGTDRTYFFGLGYQTNELAPTKYLYNRDLYAEFPGGASMVMPQYGGEDGEVAFFTIVDNAYFLTQNGTPTMRSLNVNFPQVERAPLPESPGTLATFTLNNIGYVVNQRPGQPVRLWAYTPATNTWTRKADFPGTVRSRGVGFSVGSRGYFGLGTDARTQQGLRDLWQYDPATDRWQYVTDYPGQGNRYLAVLSGESRALLGWGYEAQPTTSGAVRQVGCTDWWEFRP